MPRFVDFRGGGGAGLFIFLLREEEGQRIGTLGSNFCVLALSNPA